MPSLVRSLALSYVCLFPDDSHLSPRVIKNLMLLLLNMPNTFFNSAGNIVADGSDTIIVMAQFRSRREDSVARFFLRPFILPTVPSIAHSLCAAVLTQLGCY